MSTTNIIRVLQTLRLKGRVPPAELAAASGFGDDACASIVTELIAGSLAEETHGRLKLTAAGRERLGEELSHERETQDQATLLRLYGAFDTYNDALKTLMTRWQLKNEHTPNDHTDAAYDQAVVDDLMTLDREFVPLLAEFVRSAPRLAHYPQRFATALQRIRAGDHSWFAKPLADSYHTVWFELHEDLIALAGLTRAEEAAAGRAQ